MLIFAVLTENICESATPVDCEEEFILTRAALRQEGTEVSRLLHLWYKHPKVLTYPQN